MITFAKNSAVHPAKMRDHLVTVHTNTIVRNAQSLGVLVESHINTQFTVVTQQFRLLNGLKAQFINGVRSIRDQLAQKDLTVGVQFIINCNSCFASV